MPDITVHGSEHEYEFTVRRLGASLPDIGGVYIITKAIAPAASRHEMLYIGCARNIKGELKNHPKKACFKKHGATTIGVLIESHENRCSSIAAELIAKHEPPCNHDLKECRNDDAAPQK